KVECAGPGEPCLAFRGGGAPPRAGEGDVRLRRTRVAPAVRRVGQRISQAGEQRRGLLATTTEQRRESGIVASRSAHRHDLSERAVDDSGWRARQTFVERCERTRR